MSPLARLAAAALLLNTAAGLVLLGARLPGDGPRLLVDLPAALEPAAPVAPRVLVLDSAGRPVAGARLRLHLVGAARAEAVTDSAGTAEITLQAPATEGDTRLVVAATTLTGRATVRRPVTIRAGLVPMVWRPAAGPDARADAQLAGLARTRLHRAPAAGRAVTVEIHARGFRLHRPAIRADRFGGFTVASPRLPDGASVRLVQDGEELLRWPAAPRTRPAAGLRLSVAPARVSPGEAVSVTATSAGEGIVYFDLYCDRQPVSTRALPLLAGRCGGVLRIPADLRGEVWVRAWQRRAGRVVEASTRIDLITPRPSLRVAVSGSRRAGDTAQAECTVRDPAGRAIEARLVEAVTAPVTADQSPPPVRLVESSPERVDRILLRRVATAWLLVLISALAASWRAGWRSPACLVAAAAGAAVCAWRWLPEPEPVTSLRPVQLADPAGLPPDAVITSPSGRARLPLPLPDRPGRDRRRILALTASGAPAETIVELAVADRLRVELDAPAASRVGWSLRVPIRVRHPWPTAHRVELRLRPDPAPWDLRSPSRRTVLVPPGRDAVVLMDLVAERSGPAAIEVVARGGGQESVARDVVELAPAGRVRRRWLTGQLVDALDTTLELPRNEPFSRRLSIELIADGRQMLGWTCRLLGPSPAATWPRARLEPLSPYALDLVDLPNAVEPLAGGLLAAAEGPTDPALTAMLARRLVALEPRWTANEAALAVWALAASGSEPDAVARGVARLVAEPAGEPADQARRALALTVARPGSRAARRAVAELVATSADLPAPAAAWSLLAQQAAGVDPAGRELCAQRLIATLDPASGWGEALTTAVAGAALADWLDDHGAAEPTGVAVELGGHPLGERYTEEALVRAFRTGTNRLRLRPLGMGRPLYVIEWRWADPLGPRPR